MIIILLINFTLFNFEASYTGIGDASTYSSYLDFIDTVSLIYFSDIWFYYYLISE